MPIVHIKMLNKNRTVDQKRQLVKRIADVIEEVLGSKRDNITITLDEMEFEDYSRGGVLYCDKENK